MLFPEAIRLAMRIHGCAGGLITLRMTIATVVRMTRILPTTLPRTRGGERLAEEPVSSAPDMCHTMAWRRSES